MANGILRRGYGFLVAEDSFDGSIGDNQIFYLPLVEMTMTPVVGIAENTSMMGSSYEVNDTRPDRLMANLELTFKLNEDVFPLLLLNKYTITSEVVSGETTVYEHTAAYTNTNEGTSYKFVFIDQDRTDEQYDGLVFSSMNFTVEANQYIQVVASARANFPTPSTIDGTITTTGEFVSRNMIFEMSDYGDALTSFPLTAFSATNEYGEPDEMDEATLGSSERTNALTTVDRFSIEATAHLPNYILRNKWRDNQAFVANYRFVDTTRFVTGSVASTRPSVEYQIPRAKITEWANEGGPNDIRKQNFTLLALDTPGISNTPHQITVVNQITDYDVSSS